MMRFKPQAASRFALLFFLLLCALPLKGFAESTEPQQLGVEEEEEASEWGNINPGRGFKVAKTPYGDLDISLYLLLRYLNQLPASQTAYSHLGVPYDVNPRNDIQLQREMLFLSGWIYDPKLRYQSLIWTVNSTNQVAVAGNLNYTFSKAFILFGGIGALPGSRSLLGSFPYFYGTDRQMADEFFRPGFTSGVWARGEPVKGLAYAVMVGDNLSLIGINAAKLTRELATSAQIWVMPTTGEFGVKEGFSDYEYHEKFATRFGVGFTHSRENRYSQPSISAPDNTQIRDSDGVLFFSTGALADGVTVNNADYYMTALAAGFKYRGISFNAEYYFRWLSNIDATGPIPESLIYDKGFTTQAGYELLPKRLGVYGVGSVISGQFSNSYEGGAGANFYPVASTRNWRLNAEGLYVYKSSQGSLFGYYAAGERGPILSLATDIFF
ncbi:MAG: hypothetical protein P4M08_01435 [Oligoflexia bacterium]|nr:hypothetical protein [Oligoflexia bacterium]